MAEPETQHDPEPICVDCDGDPAFVHTFEREDGLCVAIALLQTYECDMGEQHPVVVVQNHTSATARMLAAALLNAADDLDAACAA